MTTEDLSKTPDLSSQDKKKLPAQCNDGQRRNGANEENSDEQTVNIEKSRHLQLPVDASDEKALPVDGSLPPQSEKHMPTEALSPKPEDSCDDSNRVSFHAIAILSSTDNKPSLVDSPGAAQSKEPTPSESLARKNESIEEGITRAYDPCTTVQGALTDKRPSENFSADVQNEKQSKLENRSRESVDSVRGTILEKDPSSTSRSGLPPNQKQSLSEGLCENAKGPKEDPISSSDPSTCVPKSVSNDHLFTAVDSGSPRNTNKSSVEGSDHKDKGPTREAEPENDLSISKPPIASDARPLPADSCSAPPREQNLRLERPPQKVDDLMKESISASKPSSDAPPRVSSSQGITTNYSSSLNEKQSSAESHDPNVNDLMEDVAPVSAPCRAEPLGHSDDKLCSRNNIATSRGDVQPQHEKVGLESIKRLEATNPSANDLLTATPPAALVDKMSTIDASCIQLSINHSPAEGSDHKLEHPAGSTGAANVLPIAGAHKHISTSTPLNTSASIDVQTLSAEHDANLRVERQNTTPTVIVPSSAAPNAGNKSSMSEKCDDQVGVGEDIPGESNIREENDNEAGSEEENDNEAGPEEESDVHSDMEEYDSDAAEISDLDDLRELFKAAVERISKPGHFACGDEAKGMPYPHITVNGVADPIGIPVTRYQARELIAVAEQAPHGRGEKTIVDTSVRNSWRIAPHSMSFKNPAWHSAFAEIVKKAAKDLGVDADVEAHLHNLLVYEPGGKFEKHRDSEKEQGMFGTLVVVLPSIHKGGDLIIRHNGTKCQFSCAGEKKSFGIHWFAFYADCLHEILPITEGYRVALVYNLVRIGISKNEPALVPPCAESAVMQFESIARRWSSPQGCNTTEHLVWILEHQYTEDSNGWDALKGADDAVVKSLRAAGRRNGNKKDSFDMYLVDVKYEESGDDGYESDLFVSYGPPIIHDTELTVKKWRKLPDADLPDVDENSIDISERHLVQGEDYFENEDADDSEHEGYTGNEGAPMRRWYHRSAVVLWPKEMRLQVLGLSSCLELLQNALFAKNENGAQVAKLVNVCCSMNDWDGDLAIRMANLFSHQRMKLAFCHKFLLVLGQPCLRDELSTILRQLIARFGIFSIEKGVSSMLQNMSALGEKGTQACWRALASLTDNPNVNPAFSRICSQLVPEIKMPTSSQPAAMRRGGLSDLYDWYPSSYSYIYGGHSERQAESERQVQFVTDVLVTLIRHNLMNELSQAVSKLASNAGKLDAFKVLAPALQNTIKKFPQALNTPGVQALATAIVAELNKPSASIITVDLSALLATLIMIGKVAEGLECIVALPQRFPAATAFFPGISKLLVSENREKVVQHAEFAKAVLTCLSQELSSAVGNANRSGAAQSQHSVDRDSPIEMNSVLKSKCAVKDALNILHQYGNSEDAKHYALEAAKVVTQHSPVDTVIIPMLKELPRSADVRSQEWYQQLVQCAISNVRQWTSRKPMMGKNWKMSNVKWSCNCASCREAKNFFAHPEQAVIVIRGRNATQKGHLTQQLCSLAEKAGSEFSAQCLTSRATTVNGRLQITKSAAGRTPVSELQRQKAALARFEKDLKTLKFLESISLNSQDSLQTASPAPAHTVLVADANRCSSLQEHPAPGAEIVRAAKRRKTGKVLDVIELS